MYVTIAAKPDMLAVELSHYVTKPVSFEIATMLISQLGHPPYRGGKISCWYAEAEIQSPVAMGHIVRIASSKVPFALTVDTSGNATIRVRMDDQEAMLHVIASLVPAIYAQIVEPMVQRRA